jgi:hypothetical protein
MADDMWDHVKTAAKAALDPTGMLHPGVLIDPTRGAVRD